MAIVVFFIAIALTLAGSWFIGFAALAPNPSTMPEAQYFQFGTDGDWHAVTFGPPITQDEYDEQLKQKKPGDNPPIPVGARVMTVPEGVIPDYRKALKATIEMPDVSSRDFYGVADQKISAEWHKALHRVIFKQWVVSVGAAGLLTLALSYLLQSLYRALLYVIYGSRREPSLNS